MSLYSVRNLGKLKTAMKHKFGRFVTKNVARYYQIKVNRSTVNPVCWRSGGTAPCAAISQAACALHAACAK